MGYFLVQGGGHLLAQGGGNLLTQGPVSLPFPQSPLDLQCDLNLAGTWTGVSTYAYQRDGQQAPVTITRGRPDETSQAVPATCAWQWNNRDGRFSPRNPLSPYYGVLQRNTPVRWSVPASGACLRLEADDEDRAYVNETSTLDISGSIEMRIEFARLTDWRACVLAAKWDGTACWNWQLNDDGTLFFEWYDGTDNRWVTSSQPIPYSSGAFALKATMNAGTGTVTFYTASSIDGTYSQLGSAASASGGASTVIQTGSSPLVVGYSFNFPGQMRGSVNEFRLYNGIAGSGGTVAADAVFTAQAPGATGWTDTAGNAWLLAGGAEISDRDYRFHGEMSQLPPRWDVTGTDHWVAAQAGGPLRRLSQGTKNAVSAMRRAVMSLSGDLVPVVYYPMEDAAGATVFGSAIGGTVMTFDQSPAPNLASDSTFTASAPLPSFNGSRFQAPVPAYAGTGTWVVRFLLKLSPPSTGGVLMRVVAPGGACGVVYITGDANGNLGMTGYAPDGSEPLDTGPVAGFSAAQGVWCSLEATPAAGGVQYQLVTLLPGASTAASYAVTVTSSLGAGVVSLVQPDVTGLFGSTVIGHLTVQSALSSLFTLGSAFSGWEGEAAAARYARLAAENGYQCRIAGSPGQSAAMGPQGQATLQALLQECEAADLGQAFEPRQCLGLGYRTLASMCNQAPGLTLDYTAAELGGVSGDGAASGLDPAFDDLLSKNDWTLTRGAASGSQGATVQAQLTDGSAMSTGAPPGGMGDYGNSATVNVQYDDQLQDVAGWLVHAGTVDDLRWPSVPLNLARPETAALQAAARALDAGDMLQVTDAPDLVIVDPVKQLVLGFKESLGGMHWTMEYNAVPEQPYETVILDDAVYGRVDTDGSTLHASVSASATSIGVDTASGYPLWSTSPADYPLDINVGGERMTVTAVSGTSGTQAMTVTRAVNGVSKAQSAGADVRLFFAPILALT